MPVKVAFSYKTAQTCIVCDKILGISILCKHDYGELLLLLLICL